MVSTIKTPTSSDKTFNKPNTPEQKDQDKGNPQRDAGAESRPSSPSQAAEGQPASTILIDDSNVQAGYANFCRISSTPEEVILDLGLNPNPYEQGKATVKVSQQIIMNHYTAKRLLSVLSMTVQRHEQAFGVLETDVSKRVRTN